MSGCLKVFSNLSTIFNVNTILQRWFSLYKIYFIKYSGIQLPEN